MRFGTDGIRGPAGTPPITERGAERVGRAAARLASLTGGRRVLVGLDTRPSGPALARAVLRGAAGAGAEALAAGVVPTSAVATGLRAGLGDTGVVVTASHNPAADNGFKVLGLGGAKLSDAEIEQVERWLAATDAPVEQGTVADATGPAWHAYTSALHAACGDLTPLRHLRLAVDLANGAAVQLADWLRGLGGTRWVFIGGGDGEINDRCGATDPGRLARAVVDNRCSGGFAVDGDADRCVLVDERGSVVSGDALTWLLATGMGVTRLAVTVMSNAALERSLPGVEVVRTPVGDRHLQAAIARGGAQLGCEESGHVLFADGLAGGDGVLTGLRALAIAHARAGSVAHAVAPFRPFPRWLGKVAVGGRPPLDGVDTLQHAVRAGESQLGEGGRVFLRYSGTEPVLRILVEGEDEAVVGAVATAVTAAAREALA